MAPKSVQGTPRYHQDIMSVARGPQGVSLGDSWLGNTVVLMCQLQLQESFFVFETGSHVA